MLKRIYPRFSIGRFFQWKIWVQLIVRQHCKLRGVRASAAHAIRFRERAFVAASNYLINKLLPLWG